jgi:hypothetical protein
MMMMRIWATVVICLSAGGCQQADWPAVPVSKSASELTTSDMSVVSAGLNGILLADVRSRMTVVVADRTLRICAPPEFDYDCVPRRDVLPGLTHDRNRRSFRIAEAVGPGVLLASADELIAWLWERGFRDRFQSRYPGHWGPVFVTAPVYFDGGKALLYVREYGLSAVWLELTFDGSRWVVTGRLGERQV